jgi:hypothetical protein
VIGVVAPSSEEPIERRSLACEGVSNGRERGVNRVHRSTHDVQRRAGRFIGGFDQFLASPEGGTLPQEPTELGARLESMLEKREWGGRFDDKRPRRLELTIVCR